MARRFNGGLIGLVNTAKFSAGDTTGFWTANEIGLNKLVGLGTVLSCRVKITII